MNQNAGGRIKLESGSQTCVLGNDGIINREIYTINKPMTDFKARAELQVQNGDSIILVHYDRLIPVKDRNKAVAILADKQLVVVCPQCGTGKAIKSGQEEFNCCKTWEIHYMSEAATAAETQETEKYDLEGLKGEFEVWTKDSGQFGNQYALTSVQLVYLDEANPRKMTFNLYDGKTSTNGKGKPPRIEEFRAGKVTEEGKNPFWHKVDVATYQKKLTAKGYAKL